MHLDDRDDDTLQAERSAEFNARDSMDIDERSFVDNIIENYDSRGDHGGLEYVPRELSLIDTPSILQERREVVSSKDLDAYVVDEIPMRGKRREYHPVMSGEQIYKWSPPS